MIFSKSFGYALRGILYVAIQQKQADHISIAEISERLEVPKHFLAKIMKRVAEEGILHSTRGPHGGFSITDTTLQTRIMEIAKLTESVNPMNTCVLSFRKCNAKKPCPLHSRFAEIKDLMTDSLSNTTIGNLLDEKNKNFIKVITETP